MLFQQVNFIKKETLARVFSCQFCKISKNVFFTEHLWPNASAFLKLFTWTTLSKLCFTQFTTRMTAWLLLTFFIYLHNQSIYTLHHHLLRVQMYGGWELTHDFFFSFYFLFIFFCYFYFIFSLFYFFHFVFILFIFIS